MAAAAALAVPLSSSAETNAERQAKIDKVLEFIKVIEEQGSVERIGEYVSPNYQSPIPTNAPGADALGVRIRHNYEYLTNMIPGFTYDIVDSLAVGDIVVVLSNLTGSSTTGKLVSVESIWWVISEDGLITAIHTGFDSQQLASQVYG